MNNKSLGSDLEIEILIRLPVKSLMRFKCVEKSWNILIKNPSFVNRWRRHNSKYDKGHSLMIYHRPIDGFKPPYITLLSCDGGDGGEELERIYFCSLFPGNQSVDRIETYGNCNGVFFLKAFYRNSTLGQLILWNPTTKQVHLIPPAPSFCHSKYDDSLYGFCAFNDDCNINFKVVRLQQCAHVEKMIIPSGAEVYDLSTKSWTPVHHPPPFNRIPVRYYPSYTPVVNCVYHWIVTVDLHTTSNIICFDFHNNQFHQLKAPCRHVKHSSENIAEIKGSLAYVLEYHHPSPIQLEIWIMDQNRWTKMYNIGPVPWTCCISDFWKDGDQVFGGKVGKLLASYDDQGNSLSEFQTYVLNYYRCLWGSEYLQSITPLST
jgi:F-box interacting protein